MSKEKLETDFETFNKEIEELVQEAIKNIREKASAVNEEAKKVAEAVSGSLNVEEGKKP